ncbi:MAG: HisA/HisF-related TIM barrel protein, partial [Candidatus Woesearchaeota archaeon]|nr:HisA/HisF-related TIM barrel protein [Candidatus Woesearchaeota archaeon]
MIYPCIDLQNGEVVQLVRGQEKGIDKIANSYQDMAKIFADAGLTINVIDLDAAKGRGNNLKAIEEILKTVEARVGGGVRDEDYAKRLIDIGAKKVIVGTSAFDTTGLNTPFLYNLERAVGRKKVIAALDAKDNRIAIKGWQES